MVGSTLGHYEILEPLGAGGMGEVYRARDTKLDRDVAIKVLPEDFATDQDRLARFEREAKLLASLNHANIAAIYGLEDEGEQRFIVMEVVEGETLAEQISRSGGVEVDEALDIARQIAEALEAAHENGVIHRDLKPANVKVTPDGKVKVLDFGLAKGYEADGSPSEISPDLSHSPTMAAATRTGVILGTAPYMSPEQARGKPVDRRCDNWAFGCVLYELLTGRAPFRGDTVTDVLAAVVKDEPAWTALPGGSRSSIARLLRRCLNKSPNDRLQHIGDARIELREIVDADVSAVGGDGSEGRTRRAASLAAVAVAGVIVGVLATLALVTWPSDRRSPGGVPLRLDVSLPEGVVPRVGRLVRQLTISSDGRYVVFAVNREGEGPAIYRRDLWDGTTAPIPGVGGGGQPFFSPDSRSVGFFSGPRIWRVPVGGGDPVDLADAGNNFGGTWNEAGDIVYAWDAEFGLHRVPTSGGGSEPVTGFASFWTPSFLPDGKSLLASNWLSAGKGHFDLVIVDVESGESRSLGVLGVAPLYLPTGHLVFGRERDLYAVRFDLETRQVLGEAVPVVRGIGNGNSAPRQFAVSDNGVLVYLEAPETPLRELVKVDSQGNGEPYGVQPGLYRFPRVSPDGTRVSVTLEEIHDADVWIVELLDDTVRRLTDDFINQMQVWSPDGESVLYGQIDDEGVHRVYRRSVDASVAEEQVYAAVDHGHEWFGLGSVSPDGALLVGNGNPGDEAPPFGLAYVSLEEPSDLHVFVEGREGRAARLHSVRVSPEGDRVAYISNETGRSQVYVTTFPEPGPRQMVSTDGAFYPMWAPDGSGVFYYSDDEVWFVELSADPAARPIGRRALFDTSGYRAWSGNFVMSNFDVFPDGESFLMLRDVEGPVEPPRMKVIVNFFVMLEQLLPAEAQDSR